MLIFSILGIVLGITGISTGFSVKSKAAMWSGTAGTVFSVLSIFMVPALIVPALMVSQWVVGGVLAIPFYRTFKKHKMVRMKTYGIDMPRLEFTKVDGTRPMFRTDAEEYVDGLGNAAIIAGLNPLWWGPRTMHRIWLDRTDAGRRFDRNEKVEEAMNLDYLRGKLVRVYGPDSPELEASLKFTELEQFKVFYNDNRFKRELTR